MRTNETTERSAAMRTLDGAEADAYRIDGRREALTHGAVSAIDAQAEAARLLRRAIDHGTRRQRRTALRLASAMLKAEAAQ